MRLNVKREMEDRIRNYENSAVGIDTESVHAQQRRLTQFKMLISSSNILSVSSL